jgi:hypothetical protein
MNLQCKFSWETLLWHLNTTISTEQTGWCRIPTRAACMHRPSVPRLCCHSWVKQLLITYYAPYKQGGPRNLYIRTFRVLNAIEISGALLPGVVWFEHEASQSHHSGTDLTFKSLTCIHRVHRNDSSRPELAWCGWVRSEYVWDFFFQDPKPCMSEALLLDVCSSVEVPVWGPCWKCSSIESHYNVFHGIWARVKQFKLCYKHWNYVLILRFDFSGCCSCRRPEAGAEPIMTSEGCQPGLAVQCLSAWNITTKDCKYKFSVTIHF